MLPVTAFFAGLLGFLFIALSVLIIKRRYALRAALGDAGDEDMKRRIRAHANFAEYVPLALILLAVGELNGQHKWVLAVFGTLLVLGRISHAYSLIVAEVRNPRNFAFRTVGMISTFLTIGVLSLLVLIGR